MKFELNNAILILERTPAALTSLLTKLPAEWTHENEGTETWSPFDIVGHLIHGEKTDWMIRLELILDNGPDKKFEPFDRFAQLKNNSKKNMEELLFEFESLRKRNIRTLQSKRLRPKDFDLRGIHPELGPVTLGQLLSAWVVHDLGHVAQISRVMAKQYKNEVGPWSKYLTILGQNPKE